MPSNFHIGHNRVVYQPWMGYPTQDFCSFFFSVQVLAGIDPSFRLRPLPPTSLHLHY